MLLTAALWLPNLIALPIGTWTEQRTRKRRVLVTADLLRFAALASVPAAALAGRLSLAHLFVVATATGLGQVLFATAHGPFFVALVTPGQFIEANAKLSTTRSGAAVAGPALGGALVQALSAPIALLVDALSFLVSAVLIARVDAASTAPAPATLSLLARARQGMSHVVADPILRPALGCVATANFFDILATAVLVLFASRTLGLPAATIGAIFAVGALGALAGALITPRLSRRFGIGPVAITGEILAIAPLALAAAAHGPTWLAIALLTASQVLTGFGVMLMDINLNSLMTSVIPDHLRSRVAGAFTTVNYGMRPAGAILGGLLADHLGVRQTLLIAAIGGSTACLWLVFSPIRTTRVLTPLPHPAPDRA